MDAELKVSHQIENLIPRIDQQLHEVHSCQILPRSDVKRRGIRLLCDRVLFPLMSRDLLSLLFLLCQGQYFMYTAHMPIYLVHK